MTTTKLMADDTAVWKEMFKGASPSAEERFDIDAFKRDSEKMRAVAAELRANNDELAAWTRECKLRRTSRIRLPVLPRRDPAATGRARRPNESLSAYIDDILGDLGKRVTR